MRRSWLAVWLLSIALLSACTSPKDGKADYAPLPQQIPTEEFVMDVGPPVVMRERLKYLYEPRPAEEGLLFISGVPSHLPARPTELWLREGTAERIISRPTTTDRHLGVVLSDGPWIVWSETDAGGRAGLWAILAYHRPTAEVITLARAEEPGRRPASRFDVLPSINGQKVAWSEETADGARLMLYDLEQRREQALLNGPIGPWPRVWGDHVVYTKIEPKTGKRTLWLYNLKTGQDRALVSDPVFSWDFSFPYLLYALEDQSSQQVAVGRLMLKQIITDQELQVAPAPPSTHAYIVAMAGHTAVWHETPQQVLHAYDIAANRRYRLEIPLFEGRVVDVRHPRAGHNRVAFLGSVEDKNMIYVVDFTTNSRRDR